MTKVLIGGIAAAAVAVVLPHRDAAAQECPDAPQSQEEARRIAGGAFAEGQRHYETGNNRAALERFQCSFSIVPHSNTLYNIAECKEATGDLEGALRSYRSYLELFPEGEGRSRAEERIRDLETRIAASQPPEEVPPDQEVEPITPVEEQEQVQGPSRMTLARKLAWASLGLGIAMGAIGGGLYGAAVSQNNEFVDLQAQNPVTVTHGELVDIRGSGEAMEAAGWSLMGLGLAVLTTSVVLFTVFDGREPASSSNEGSQSRLRPRLGLAPVAIGDEGCGLIVSGAF